MADGSRFIQPTGKTPEQLFLTMRTLIDTLNRMKQSETTDLGSILAALEEANSQIQALWEAIEQGGGVLTPQEIFELSLVTQVESMMGSVSNLVRDTIKRSEQAAEATIKATLAGLQNKGEIRVEQVVRKSEKEVYVRQFESFDASLGNTQGALANEIIARADGDSALASSVSSLTTTVNGNTAQIVILAESVDGIEQKFAVALNSNGHVTGLLQLDGTPIGTGFTVVADKHMLAFPGINGGDPFPIFVIEDVDGTPTAVFNGLLKALSLEALSANLGLIRAGRMLSPDGKVDFNLTEGYLEMTA